MISPLSFYEKLLLIFLLACGTWARLSHLERVGVRTVDEGSYCFFAISMLNGDPKCIQDKPGQVLIVAAGFGTFGISQYAAVFTSALIGLATLPALFWLGLLISGKAAAFALTASGVFLPYFLHYNRSAASDSNYVLFCVLALCFFFKGISKGEEERKAHLKWMAASGLSFGIAATINLASVPPYALTWAFFGVLAWWDRQSLKTTAQSLLAFAGGGLAGGGVVALPLAGFIDFEKVFTQVSGHAGHILATTLKWEWAYNLWKLCGPVEIFLAIAALASFNLWWRKPPALFPLLTLVLIVFYARAKLSLPRLHVPILLGLLPLMALGADQLVKLIRERLPKTPEIVVYAGLSVFLLGVHVPAAARIVSLRSGYTETCRWLSDHMEDKDKGIATHTWWTLMSFTGRTFSFGSDRLADALNQKEWRAPFVETLQEFEDLGYSWLVLDYLLFTRVDAAGIENWKSLVKEFDCQANGGVRIENPIAGDFETWAEDAHIPPLEEEPLGHYIYVYRLADLKGAVSGDK